MSKCSISTPSTYIITFEPKFDGEDTKIILCDIWRDRFSIQGVSPRFAEISIEFISSDTRLNNYMVYNRKIIEVRRLTNFHNLDNDEYYTETIIGDKCDITYFVINTDNSNGSIIELDFSMSNLSHISNNLNT